MTWAMRFGTTEKLHEAHSEAFDSESLRCFPPRYDEQGEAVRILSVRQPYASYLVHGLKTVECRGRNTSYRGPVIIAAGASKVPNVRPDPAWATYRARLLHAAGVATLAELPLGHVIGVVDLVRVTPPTEILDDPWADETGASWHWHVTRPRLVVPFPYKGQLGLATARPDIVASLKYLES